MRLLDISKDYLFVVLGNCILKIHQSNSNIDVISYDKSNENGTCKIISLTVNEEMKYFFACFSNKLICCWNINSNELLGFSYFKKKATSIQCSSFSNTSLNKSISTTSKIQDYQVLLIADKAGDLYVTDLPTMQKQILMTGHTASVITDMKLYESLVITCDRDEKVRICHFPAIENIQAFCLGHESVVSSIDTIMIHDKVLVLSTGWDHKLILWDAMSGFMLDHISYKEQDIHSTTTSTSRNSNTTNIAEGIESYEEGKVYDVDNVEDQEQQGEMEIEGTDTAVVQEDVENKQYNEIIAGSYPLKVITASLSICNSKTMMINLAIVMFKSLSILKIYSIHTNDELKLKEELTITILPAIPIDIVINTKTNELIILLPKPYGLQVFKLQCNVIDNRNITSIEIEDKTISYNVVIMKMLELAETKGYDYMIPELSTRNDQENGMMKHTLDKRFNNQQNIEYRTNKGHKRSKQIKI